MKKVFGLLVVALLFFPALLQSAQAQGGGCPATLAASADQPDAIYQSVLLAPASPEQPSTTVPRAFRQVSAAIDWQPGSQVFISSSGEALAGVCVDDVLEGRSTSTGRVIRVDFRSGDRQRIEPRLGAISLPADMFVPGPNLIEISLIDVSPGFFSNSNLYVLVVPAERSLPSSPTVAPIASAPTSIPQPVPSSTPTVTATPPPTRTATSIPSATPTVTSTAQPTSSPEAPVRPVRPWVWLAPAGLLPLLALLMVKSRNRVRLEGKLLIYKMGQLVKEVLLAPFGAMATLGSQGDILLRGEGVPPAAARLRGQRSERGSTETIFEVLDPETGEVVEGRTWRDGDTEQIGPYGLQYVNYNQEDEFYFDEGAYDD